VIFLSFSFPLISLFIVHFEWIKTSETKYWTSAQQRLRRSIHSREFLAARRQNHCFFPNIQENHSCDISTQKTHSCDFLILPRTARELLTAEKIMSSLCSTYQTCATEIHESGYKSPSLRPLLIGFFCVFFYSKYLWWTPRHRTLWLSTIGSRCCFGLWLVLLWLSGPTTIPFVWMSLVNLWSYGNWLWLHFVFQLKRPLIIRLESVVVDLLARHRSVAIKSDSFAPRHNFSKSISVSSWLHAESRAGETPLPWRLLTTCRRYRTNR
jgi:hypothetical protein